MCYSTVHRAMCQMTVHYQSTVHHAMCHITVHHQSTVHHATCHITVHRAMCQEYYSAPYHVL